MIATGTIESGMVKVGDEVDLVGLRRTPMRTGIRSIETFRKTLDYGESGDNIGVLLRKLQPEEVQRGQCLAKPGFLTVNRNFEASIYVLKPDEGGRKLPFRSKFRPQVPEERQCSATFERQMWP